MSHVCNGPLMTGMYDVKPYYDNNMPLELPQCMYTLSSIYSSEVTGKPQAESSVANMVSAPYPTINEWSRMVGCVIEHWYRR